MKKIIIIPLLILSCLILISNDESFKNNSKNNSMSADITEGGRLYDNWFGVRENIKKPNTVHPKYPKEGKASNKPLNTWRCKECHGWDYKGKDGAYSSGSHFTGIKGLTHLQDQPIVDIKKKLEANHVEFNSVLTVEDRNKITLFLSKGIFDMKKDIDPKTKIVKQGNPINGKSYFQTLCAQCHGQTGVEAEDMPDLRKLSLKNPWESLHKILNGQPGKEMPALGALDKQISIDILAYLQKVEK